jgi:hypothetical protein
MDINRSKFKNMTFGSNFICFLFLVTLPTVAYDVETEEITVDPNQRIQLKVNGLPVATSFAVYKLPERYLGDFSCQFVTVIHLHVYFEV